MSNERGVAIGQLIALLEAEYEQTINEERVNLICALLSDKEPQFIREGALEVVKSSKFMPRTSEILSAVMTAEQRAKRTAAEEARIQRENMRSLEPPTVSPERRREIMARFLSMAKEKSL